MSKWQKELDKRLKLYETDREKYEKAKKEHEALVEACNAFTSAYSKAASKLSELFSKLQDNSEECGRAVAELMVYEDELTAAQKSKDKKEEKQVEKKMAPLIKAFEKSRVDGNKVVGEHAKIIAELRQLRAAVGKASA